MGWAVFGVAIVGIALLAVLLAYCLGKFTDMSRAMSVALAILAVYAALYALFVVGGDAREARRLFGHPYVMLFFVCLALPALYGARKGRNVRLTRFAAWYMKLYSDNAAKIRALALPPDGAVIVNPRNGTYVTGSTEAAALAALKSEHPTAMGWTHLRAKHLPGPELTCHGNGS